MAVDYNDSRFQQVNSEKEAALNNVNNMYNSMIDNSDKFYQDQINATKEYQQIQEKNQQANTDFAIEQINQQKEQANADYTKEQKASYADWQKASNRYGVNAEAMAAQGMTNTGYSESSLVSMYNTYQNRVSTARDTYNRAILQYDNSIKEAQLANNSALAEIAYKSLQTQLELSLEGFQYKNTLLQTQLAAQNETEDRYYTRWQNVLEQINTENALAEQQRQFNEQMAYQRANSYSGGYSGGGSYSGEGYDYYQDDQNLSEGGQELLEILNLRNNIENSSFYPLRNVANKVNPSDVLNKYYNEKKITENDVRILANYINL